MLRSRRLGLAVLLALIASLLAGGGTTAVARVAPAKPAACHLANAPGISAKTIDIGNVADLTGPVPGIYASAQQGVRAFAAYFNATHQTICGRSLFVTQYDAKTDAGADQQAYTTACTHVFATVGSASAFDSGGGATTQKCGLPDLRAATNTPQVRACTTCFTTHPANDKQVPNAIADVLEKSYGGGQHAAMLYLNTGNVPAQAAAMVSAETRRGMHFDVVQAIDTTEFNYGPYVAAMKAKGVQTVQFLTAHQTAPLEKLAMSMMQAPFAPKAFLLDTTPYSSTYDDYGIKTVVYLDFQPFEAPAPGKELKLYEKWLSRTTPDAEPTADGLYAWSAARLFVTTAQGLGAKLTRASLVAALRKVTNWRDNYLHVPQQVGSGDTSPCLRFIRHTGSTWVPANGRNLHCDGITTVS